MSAEAENILIELRFVRFLVQWLWHGADLGLVLYLFITYSLLSVAWCLTKILSTAHAWWNWQI